MADALSGDKSLLLRLDAAINARAFVMEKRGYKQGIMDGVRMLRWLGVFC